MHKLFIGFFIGRRSDVVNNSTTAAAKRDCVFLFHYGFHIMERGQKPPFSLGFECEPRRANCICKVQLRSPKPILCHFDGTLIVSVGLLARIQVEVEVTINGVLELITPNKVTVLIHLPNHKHL